MRPSRLLATALTVSVALAGCGSSNSNDDASGSAPSSSQQAAEQTRPTNPPVSTTSRTAAPTSPPSFTVRPEATNIIEVDDGSFGSVAEMAQASALIVVGDVIEVTSLGRPDLSEDPYADEYLAVSVRTVEILKGEPTDKVVLGWDAFNVDPDGQRVATWISNGLRSPDLGDRLLLFLVPADAAFAEHLGGAPTHQLVKLDGIAYLNGDRLIAGETNSPAAQQLIAMSLPAIREEVIN